MYLDFTVEIPLDDNPFTPAEKIYEYYAIKMTKALDDDLEDYVTCEDYYPPVVHNIQHPEALRRHLGVMGDHHDRSALSVYFASRISIS